ncbi:phosphonate ABC transporter, permease protein PhnE [Rhodopila sp.]|jgi:phosphonate transport system permease protein|uniref:phosphonate ABC transporter, permease protein PhnE n=1 Tax=Rhodopila sp. TaxID=2480087 RepID=UPI002C5BCB02|nr:phosphonate ABC transporter, permease protein PhnE [Rhodopila sp.]HVZ06873.1 phosphonate ABC transporter, permease protein PhnE [Rhodopila sp.]
MSGVAGLDVTAERDRHPEVFRPRGWWHWLLGVAALAYLIYLGALFDFGRTFTGLPRLWVILRLMADWTGFADWDHAQLWSSMLETVAMAYLGTLLGSMIALPLGFLGARNVIPNAVFRFLTRRIFDGFRGLDQLIWALVFVRAMGLGPIAGILAIAVADAGTLAKLFSEAIENIDRKPIEGITSVGAGRLAVLRYAYLPQVMPVMVSQTLYLIESNTREATILGLVGAGGIGLRLSERIQINAWDQVAYIIVLILVTVALIDTASRYLRMRLIGISSR